MMSTTPTVPAVDKRTELRLRQAAGKAEVARQDRDAQIVLAFLDGAGLREIARAVNMTHPAVKYILDKNAEDPRLIEEYAKRLAADIERKRRRDAKRMEDRAES